MSPLREVVGQNESSSAQGLSFTLIPMKYALASRITIRICLVGAMPMGTIDMNQLAGCRLRFQAAPGSFQNLCFE